MEEQDLLVYRRVGTKADLLFGPRMPANKGDRDGIRVLDARWLMSTHGGAVLEGPGTRYLVMGTTRRNNNLSDKEAYLT